MEGRKDEHEQMARDRASAKRARLVVSSSESSSDDDSDDPERAGATSPSLQQAAAHTRVNSYKESNLVNDHESFTKQLVALQQQVASLQKQNNLLEQQMTFMNKERTRIHDELQATNEQKDTQISFLYEMAKLAHPDIEDLPFGDLPSSIPPGPCDVRPRPMNSTQLSKLKSMLESTKHNRQVL